MHPYAAHPCTVNTHTHVPHNSISHSEHHMLLNFSMAVQAQTCFGICCDGSSQTNSRRTSACGTDRQVCHIHNRPEHLGLGNTRVTHHEAIDVPSQMVPICQIALPASQQKQDETLLDEVVAINGRRQRVGQLAQNIWFACQGSCISASHILTSVST